MKQLARPLAGLLALLGALAAGAAAAQQSHEAAQAAKTAQEQRDGTPQAQEEQAGNAAQQPQRKSGEQPVKGQPQDQPQDMAPRKDGKKPPPKRRAVPAIIGSMPAPTAPQAYGPVLHPAAPQTPMPANLPPPAPINTCIGNQCTDASGNSYQTGVGNAALDSKGRLCNRNGTTMQCF